ncbi:MAG TPA: Hsp20/alpha crystallin family protein [Candidatus Acidoferrales bacterium]|nr:Hsp20/alpha crystallin family protein [Candidatus Acidoferrales bacterium]
MPITDDWIWQHASELMEHAERIHRCFFQAALSSVHSVVAEASWAPPVTIVETGSALWVIYALPGIRANEIRLTLQDNELVISGYRPLPECCAEGELKFMEIPFGRFHRRLRLPEGSSFSVGETQHQEGLVLVQLRKL